MSNLSSSQLAALQDAARSSVACEQRTAVPAELTLNQWALESSWGAHAPGNNCFGIKAYPGCFGVQSLKTVEFVNGVAQRVVKPFATFASVEACFEKHAALITSGKAFAAAWETYRKDLKVDALTRRIAVSYATSPNYAEMVLRIGKMPEVKNALAQARIALAA